MLAGGGETRRKSTTALTKGGITPTMGEMGRCAVPSGIRPIQNLLDPCSTIGSCERVEAILTLVQKAPMIKHVRFRMIDVLYPPKPGTGFAITAHVQLIVNKVKTLVGVERLDVEHPNV